ncbi:MAG: VRR-NUC domain-containing protein [Alphaproteobacteria bacterium]|nr:VRR-NUC domain-containing protein [Alphaproteobacteria bacterium]
MQPSSPEPAPVAWALADLRRAVEVAVAREGILLSAGELHITRAFLALPEPAAALYARLHGRKGHVFRLDGLTYDEVPDIAIAATALVDAGFAWRGERLLPPRALATALTVAELKAVCRQLGARTSGRRDELLARVDRPDAAPLLRRPLLLLRHDALFLRVARLFLGRAHADLSRLVVERLELVRWPTYTPTGGPGLFSRRSHLRAWEDGLAVDAALWAMSDADQGSGLLARLPDDLRRVERDPLPPPWRARLSARRLASARCQQAARILERQGATEQAIAVYERLLAAGLSRPGNVLQRLAIARGVAGRPGDGARLCQQHVSVRADPSGAVLPAEERIALERTGRRLARQAGLGWAPSPPLRPPAERSIDLPLASTSGARPTWERPGGPMLLEPAVVDLLAELGRTALHAEGGLWRTLFGLLFAEVLFLPVPGMLPTPLRTGPLDLGRPGFVARRQDAIDAVLEGVRRGEGPARLAQAWTEREGQAIAGVDWSWPGRHRLERVLDDLGGPGAAAILACIADDWRDAPRGLPDLVVLSGPAARLPDSFPSRLSSDALLVELKGPGDQLRDAQRVWLDRLVRSGLRAELWRVRARS